MFTELLTEKECDIFAAHEGLLNEDLNSVGTLRGPVTINTKLSSCLKGQRSNTWLIPLADLFAHA
jgi:hypothetical protein